MPYREFSGPPVTAFGGGMFLTVWPAQEHNTRLYAVRVRASDGQLLDDRRRLGIPFPFGSSTPVVVWNGESFSLFSFDGKAIYLMRVSTDGKLIDGAPVEYFRPDKGIGALAVARGNSEDLMVWTSTGDVMAARFGHDGKILGTSIRLGAPVRSSPRLRSTARTTWWCGTSGRPASPFRI